jgi:hypothetical protein
MTETREFGLPLVQAAQAQKHVTVNEAFARLDAVSCLRIEARDLMTPPSAPEDGTVYAVGIGATAAWTGQEGALAIAVNGDWRFVLPKRGWTAWDVTLDRGVIFDGTDWVDTMIMPGAGGAATRPRVIEFDHVITAGATNLTTQVIPARGVVQAVTARVTSAISGAGTTGWQLGVSGSPDRHGSGLGVSLNSYAAGVTGQPVTYWSDTPLQLTAEGGDFASGTVRIAIHLVEFLPPRAV